MKDRKKTEAAEPEAPQAQGDDLQERVAELEGALKAKEEEAAANWERYLRERADLENQRKRFQKEKEDLLKYGNETLLTEILPAVDNLERALEHAGEGCDDSVTAGVRMTLSMLLSSLKKFGVSPIESAKGTAFDPTFHQAMAQVETAEVGPNAIVQEFQKGYMLNDRLLRPAMVSVAVAPKG